MPVIRRNSGFLGNAGKAAAAFNQTTQQIQESEVRLKALRDRREVAELERMRRIQQESARREFAERQFAFDQQQAALGALDSQRQRDIQQQQQDRLDAQEYSSGLDSGVMPVEGQSVLAMRQRLERINPGLAQQFDEQWATMTAGEYEGISAAEAYGDPRYLRRGYKSITALLGQAEDLADAQAKASAPGAILDPLDRQYPGFLETVEGQEFANEVASVFQDPKYGLNSMQAGAVAKQLRQKGIGIARREHERKSYESRVLGWTVDPPEGWDIPEPEEVDALLDEIATSTNPRQAYEKAERRFDPKLRKVALETAEEERQRMAAENTIRHARSLPGADSMAASAEAVAGGGVAPEPEKPVALPEDIAAEKNRAQRKEEESQQNVLWLEFLDRNKVDRTDEAAVRKAAEYWRKLQEKRRAYDKEEQKLRDAGAFYGNPLR